MKCKALNMSHTDLNTLTHINKKKFNEIRKILLRYDYIDKGEKEIIDE